MSEPSHKDKLAEVLAAGMNRRSFMKLMGSGAGLAAGSAIMGSALVQNAMAAAPKRGGTIKLAWVDAVDTLDPHFTASASHGSPLWNFTPRRSLNTWVLSSGISQLSARSGTKDTFLPS